jgi:hypothetical protein
VIRYDDVLPVGGDPNCTILEVDLRDDDVAWMRKEEIHAIYCTFIDVAPIDRPI